MKKAGGREAILTSALKLFAERDLDAVRTAEILASAGQKNQGALQYHFGSREGLYLAILYRHLEGIDARRMEIINPRGLTDPKPSFATCVRGVIEPLIDEAETGEWGDAYLRFLRQIVARNSFNIVEITPGLQLPGMKMMIQCSLRYLTDLPPDRQSLALNMMLQVSVTMLTTWRLLSPGAFERDEFVNAAIATCKAMYKSMIVPETLAPRGRSTTGAGMKRELA
ncbi:TetR family transcriptional regulator [Zavarzinia compransoris]|uniref:TetR/AcrR family transcriptional regulator n=1 Tax=Zavarzinia marina TaxID=2911065 RepID=UPI001F39A1C5|nr:TetR family transcriptional regulator [Zavarzinia marina]MCF4165024.1 TetR family transcriptional regulator [Zavarzinia marina]